MSLSFSYARSCHLSLTCLHSIIGPCSSYLTLAATMSELDNITTASCGESMLLAAKALPTSSPINAISTASVVPAPTASQFDRELEDIRVAEALVSIREGPNTTQRSHTLDTIPEMQDLDVDPEVVLC